MKVDVLKIDMGFLRKTEADMRAKSIIKSIIQLAHDLEMVVVTEGVETIEQIEFLTTAGCDVFQGIILINQYRQHLLKRNIFDYRKIILCK